MVNLRSVVVWAMGLLIVAVSFGLAAGSESGGEDSLTGSDTALACEETGVFVSDWAHQLADGRIDAVTISDVDEACIGAEIAASVGDADGTIIASTETRELTGSEVTLAFPDERPLVAQVEQFHVFIVGAGDPPEDDPPPDPPPSSVPWDGEGPSQIECGGPVDWTFKLTGNLRGVKAEVTAVFTSAGAVGPVAAERSGGGPDPDLVATLTTAQGDVLEQAWATLNKDPDDSMNLTLDEAVCSEE